MSENETDSIWSKEPPTEYGRYWVRLKDTSGNWFETIAELAGVDYWRIGDCVTTLAHITKNGSPFGSRIPSPEELASLTEKARIADFLIANMIREERPCDLGWDAIVDACLWRDGCLHPSRGDIPAWTQVIREAMKAEESANSPKSSA